MTFRS